MSPEDAPHLEGIRRRHMNLWAQKDLNDYLAPLRRYLAKQVGRPCNKIYSEICRAPASPVLNAHLRRHIDDFVALDRRDRRPFFVDRKTDFCVAPIRAPARSPAAAA